MNRNGQLGSQLMIFVFLFLLILVAGGIVAGTYMFFGQGYDIRQSEADALNFRVSDCFSSKIIDFSAAGDFFSQCSLSGDVLNESIYMMRIRECANPKCDNGKVIFSLGSNFEACGLTGKNDAYPKCATQRVMKEGKDYEILTASNQLPRSVSL